MSELDGKDIPISPDRLVLMFQYLIQLQAESRSKSVGEIVSGPKLDSLEFILDRAVAVALIQMCQWSSTATTSVKSSPGSPELTTAGSILVTVYYYSPSKID